MACVPEHGDRFSGSRVCLPEAEGRTAHFLCLPALIYPRDINRVEWSKQIINPLWSWLQDWKGQWAGEELRVGQVLAS